MSTTQHSKCPNCDLPQVPSKSTEQFADRISYLFECPWCQHVWCEDVSKPWVRKTSMPQVYARLVAIMLFTLTCASTAMAQDGNATYYTTKSCQAEGTSGVFTANGERFDEHAMTCALRRRDFGKHYLVYAHETGKSIIVRHNDFGPGEQSYYEHGNIIDLTPAGMKALGIKGRGPVSVQEVIE